MPPPSERAAATRPGSGDPRVASGRGDAYRWRQVATLLCFAAFGVSGLVFGFVVTPAMRLRHRDPAARGRALRRALRTAMRINLGLMRALRVLDWRTEGTVPDVPGAMIVANHPSLIDAVILLAVVPDALCIAKQALADNPFIGRAVRALGYPVNANPRAMVAQCVGLLRAGHTLVVFPEGTRTPAGRPLGPLQRGAAHIAVRSGCPVHPATIRVSEPTLSKGAPWWRVPDRRPSFVVRFHAPRPGARAGSPASSGAAAREASRQWEALFCEEIARADLP